MVYPVCLHESRRCATGFGLADSCARGVMRGALQCVPCMILLQRRNGLPMELAPDWWEERTRWTTGTRTGVAGS